MNPFKCHEEVLSLQPMVPPKGCSEGLVAFIFFFKHTCAVTIYRFFFSCVVFRTVGIPDKVGLSIPTEKPAANSKTSDEVYGMGNYRETGDEISLSISTFVFRLSSNEKTTSCFVLCVT